MDNNELDKIIKEKLKDTIKPSKEFENKIKQDLINRKNSFKQVKDEKKTKKRISYKTIASISSVAAMLVMIFTVGVLYLNNGEDAIFPKIPGISGTQEEKNNKSKIAIIKAIEPIKLKSGLIEKDTEFLITVEEDSSVEAVQRSLYVEPALEYEITKTGTNEFKLKFKQNIPDNTILKLQYVKDQITEDSWAYQTNTNLSVTSIYPANNSTYVSKNTTMEIEFSYADVENFEENISINPKTEGIWEHKGKLWRFIPESPLKEGRYTIIVNKNILADGKNMADDFIFNFSVSDEVVNSYSHYAQDVFTTDGIETFLPEEQIKIFYLSYGNDVEIKKVKIGKIDTADEFIKAVESKNYENAKYIGDYEFDDVRKTYDDKFIALKKNLPIGYYVATIESEKGKELFKCPIQISKMQAYVMESERDIIAWVAEDEKLANGININYLDKTQKTNKDGIAKLSNITDGSEKIRYVKIGNDENILVVGVNNFKQDRYPNSFVYVDRPLYKSKDTVNIWGFVPRTLFVDKIDENEFYIGLEENGQDKKKVKVEDSGSINYKLNLNNRSDGYERVYLFYKDSIIGETYFKIQNYVLQNYEYEITMNKNYAYIDEDFSVEVKVTHVTGIQVPNKAVLIDYKGQRVKAKTDNRGIATATFKAKDEYSSNYSGLTYQSIEVYNGDSEEYTNAMEMKDFYVLNRDVYINVERDKNYIKADLHTLIKNKIQEISKIEDLYDDIYNTDIEVYLREEKTERVISGYQYNEYTKENETQYKYERSQNEEFIKTIKTSNGKFEFDGNSIKRKQRTDDIWYNYDVIFRFKDTSGKLVEYVMYYIYDDSEEINNRVGYRTYSWPYYFGERYNTYRYYFELADKKYSIGDKIDLILKESTINGEKQIQNKGKVLRIAFRENILKTDIIDNDNLSYTFSNEDFPGINITGAYFLNGKFYRMPSNFYDFNQEDRKVDIEISADKDKYKPGELVTLTLKTTNNGKPIKTAVNISVVNEAVFLTENEENRKLLNVIYNTKNNSVYTFSSYIDYLERIITGGEGGGGKESRSKFGDTPYFETVETNSRGEVTVKFKLPDNVTTYRVTAHAANKDLYLGENTAKITSTLDFFIQFTEPRGVKSSDDLVLSATSIAETDYKADFEFTIEELNKTLTTSANTNNMASVNFGKIPVGKYHAVIKATNGDLEDSVKYEFEVVEATQEVKQKTTINVNEQVEINPSKNPIKLEIYNKQMKQYMDYIDFVEETVSSRLDTRIAYNEVQKIKSKYYGTSYDVNELNLENYMIENSTFKNLPKGEEDLTLTALIKYYAGMGNDINLKDSYNLFEYYLYLSAQGKPVLQDLKYLAEDKEIDNYGKLLTTLSFEFLGDYKSARELYNSINLSDNEKQEYGSIIAIIDTFIDKTKAASEINDIIKNKPTDEYVRFAILSFFKNNSNEMSEEQKVAIRSNSVNETITLNGLQIKTFTIYDSDLSTIKFDTTSKDIMVSYYYQTSIENVENKNISKDITIKINGEIKKNNEVTLVINLSKLKNEEGEVRIALPNSLRLARDFEGYDKDYYLENNRIEYLTFYKQKGCTQIKVPLLVTLDGEFKFENVIFTSGDGIYHISNTL